MRRLTIKGFVLCVVLITVLLPLTTVPVVSQRTGAIKVGVVLSTDGSAKPYGENALNGIRLAQKEIGLINGREIKLIEKNSKTDAKEAVKVLRELIDTDKVQVVIGDVTSTCVLAMEPVINERKIVLITPGASYPRLSKKGDYLFRYWYSDELEGKADARFAWYNLNWKRVATVYIDIPYGQGISEEFVKEFRRLGGAVETEIRFAQNETNFASHFSSLASLNVDGLFFASYRNESVSFLTALRSSPNERLRQLGILSTQPFHNMEIVRRAGTAAENVYFSVPRQPAPDKPGVAKRFRESYQREYNIDIRKDPRDFSETAYDSLKIVAEAFRTGAYSATQIKQSLENQKFFEGAFGDISFDANGDIVVSEFDFKQVRNGQFWSLGQVPVALPDLSPPSSRLPEWLHSTTAQAVATIAAAAFLGFVAWLFYRWRFPLWHRLRWRRAVIWFWWERLFNRSRRKIVTLNDYVDILNELRNIVRNKANNIRGDKKAVITIYSYTMQIPRDWPLWQADLKKAEDNPTPLEKYFLNFKEFLNAQGQKYTVNVKRVIVIDSSSSPMGLARFGKLQEDVRNTNYYEKYIERLHSSEEDAYFYRYERPWPGWFSDSVFYALQLPDTPRRWLWGVTTSYNAAEDLIILRLHKMKKQGTRIGRRLAKQTPLSKKTFEELAELAETMQVEKLEKLKID